MIQRRTAAAGAVALTLLRALHPLPDRLRCNPSLLVIVSATTRMIGLDALTALPHRSDAAAPPASRCCRCRRRSTRRASDALQRLPACRRGSADHCRAPDSAGPTALKERSRRACRPMPSRRCARACATALPETALDRHILAWAIALQGGQDVPSSDIAAAARGAAGLAGHGNAARATASGRSIARSPAPEPVIERFRRQRSRETSEGVILLARAYAAAGEMNGARAVLSPFWRTEKLDAPGRSGASSRSSAPDPDTADHRARMERMLYADRINSAERVAELAEAKALCDAWAAVHPQRQEGGQAARRGAGGAALGRLCLRQGAVSAAPARSSRKPPR